MVGAITRTELDGIAARGLGPQEASFQRQAPIKARPPSTPRSGPAAEGLAPPSPRPAEVRRGTGCVVSPRPELGWGTSTTRRRAPKPPPTLDKLPEMTKLSRRNNLRHQLSGQGAVQVQQLPDKSVLKSHTLGPTNGCFGSFIPGSMRYLAHQRRAPSRGLETKALPEVKATLNEQLESAWSAVAAILYSGGCAGGGLPAPAAASDTARPDNSSQRPASLRAAGRQARPEPPPGGQRPPSSSRSASKGQGGWSRRPGSSPSSREVVAVGAAQGGLGQGGARWVVPAPEAALDLVSCHGRLTEHLAQLRRSHSTLGTELQSDELERVSTEVAIASGRKRLENIDTNLADLAKQRDEYDEQLRALEEQHASLVDASRALLDTFRSKHVKLPDLS